MQGIAREREITVGVARRRLERLPVLCILIVWTLTAFRLTAQVSGGVLSGTITSESGAQIPDAEISVTNLASGATRMVKTNTAGFYTAPNLPAGSYNMTVTAGGFSTQARTGIAVAVGSRLVLNVAMKAGNPSEVIRMAAAPLSQGSSAGGGNVSSSAVRNTPLNGRDWTQLATLQAGVTGVQTGSATGGGNVERGFGAAMSISGARPDQNNFRVDGISVNDYANGAPGSVLGDSLGVDAVEQFSVLGSNYPAEYGRTSGGVINAVTRSGTNAFHGSVYEFLRNSAFDARNFFDGNIPPFRRNQFGASAGGPIQEGRTFFFADYEGLRQSLGVTTVDTMPSMAARAGNLCSIPGGVSPACTPTLVAVDPSVARFLQAFFPLPNGPLLGDGDTGIFTFAGQQVTNENYITTRIDRKLSEKDSITGTYMHDDSKTVQPDAFTSLLSNIVSSRQLATLHEQHILSPGSLNVARAGFNRAVGVDGGITRILNPLVEDPSFAFIPGQFPGTIASVPGITKMPDTPSAQDTGTLEGTKSLYWNSFQAGDDVFLARGVNAFQFGAVAERLQDNALDFFSSNGTFRFSSLSNLLSNRPRAFTGFVPKPVIRYGTRETLFGAYFQDDIHARPNLTLNVGLRYEVTSVPTEAHNKLANLPRLTDSQAHLGSPYFLNPTLHNFEPRVGFAFRPSAGSRTFLRGGFGIFDVLPLPYEFRDITPNPFPFAQQIFGEDIPAGSFPAGAYPLFASSTQSSRSTYVEHSPKRSYVMQWNFSVAQELSPSLVATVGYVGSRGVHQPFRVDNIDMVLPALTHDGYLFPPITSSQRLNPNFGRVTAMLWQANSFYDALQADLAKRVSHGIEFHAAYTWGKSLDTLSATVADDNYPNGMLNPLFFDQRTTRGLSDFNVSQDLVVSYTWELGAPKSRWTAANWVFSGWQLGGVFKASSGQPFTPLLGGDPEGTKLDETSEPPSLAPGPGCASLVNPGNPNHYIKTQCLTFPSPASLRGNLGRNTLIGPGVSNFDFSVFKNNRIRRVSEDFNAQFRAEFFNVFNRANFASPTDNLDIFDQSGAPVASAGLITSTQTPSRQIQFALKFIW